MFDADFVKRLEYLSLLSRRMFRGQLLAQKRTMQTGGGIELSDPREYFLGEDLRFLLFNGTGERPLIHAFRQGEQAA